MKRTTVSFLILITIVLVIFSMQTIKASENTAGGQKIYQSLPAKNQAEMEKMGLDYKKLNLIKIYQYILFDEKTIYYVGFTKSGNFELVRVSLPDPKMEIISSTREDLSQSSPNFKIVIMHKLETTPFIVYEYTTRINKKIEIFSGDEKYHFQSINKENVTLKSKVFITDANTDGYPDILIWAKIPSKEKKVENIGEMTVMFFDPQAKKFQSPVLMREIKGLTSGL